MIITYPYNPFIADLLRFTSRVFGAVACLQARGAGGRAAFVGARHLLFGCQDLQGVSFRSRHVCVCAAVLLMGVRCL